MGEKTNIAWTDHTFNTHWGCTEISPGCDNCYARELAKRFGVQWGVNAERRIFGDAHWNEPIRWNHAAERAGRHARVFCASMADVFDNQAPEGIRARLFDLIAKTPHLDWLLLTKRIGNVAPMLRLLAPASWPWPNVWLGASIVNQDEADRDIPKLLAVPARIRFLSVEPMLGPVQFPLPCRGSVFWSGLHWIIVGGESGPHARPMEPDWARNVRDQCAGAGVPYFFKQHGGRTHDKGGCLLDGQEAKAWPTPA